MTAIRKTTILIVEDDIDIANLVRFRLTREGFGVRHAKDGDHALREFDDPVLPDLVLMDVMMPYHNGYELLADLRKRKGWEKLPVIMLTSRSKEQDVVEGFAELIARIHKLLPRD